MYKYFLFIIAFLLSFVTNSSFSQNISFISSKAETGHSAELFNDNFHYAKALSLSEITVFTDKEMTKPVDKNVYKQAGEPKVVTTRDKKNDYNSTFQVNLVFNIEGTFYVKAKIRATSQDNVVTDVYRYWEVKVFKPVLYTPFEWKEKFIYPGFYSFSFAVNGYDYSQFSYKIVDQAGNEVEAKQGANVNLDKILNDPGNVGKSFTITGLYNGEIFEYYNDYNSTEKKKSEWSFKLDKPELVFMTDFWVPSEKFDPASKIAVDLSATLAGDASPLIFYFYYVSDIDKEKGIRTFSYPEFSGIRVTSKTPDFLDQPAYERSIAKIKVNVNQKFLNSIKAGEKKLVDLKIVFDTQFNDYFEQEFKTYVIKPFGAK